MASSSSSSLSILSAKAKPFVPPSTKPNSSLSAKAPPFAKPNFNQSSQMNTLIGSPYYPSYDGLSDFELLGFEGFPFSGYDGDNVSGLPCGFQDFQGMNVGPWNAPFDEKAEQSEESDWVSLPRVPSLGIQGVWPDVTVAPKISGTSTSALSSRLYLSTSATKSFNATCSNPSSNSYAEHIYSCSTNPAAYFPVSAHATSPQPYAPLVKGTSSTAESLSKTSDSRHFLPELTINPQVEGQEGFDGKIRANSRRNMNPVITVDSSVTRKPISTSDYDCSLASPLKLPKTLTSECESVRQDNYKEDPSETVSQLELDVDSPCWKGTQAYKRPPFYFDKAATPHLTSAKSVSDADVTGQLYVSTNSGDVTTTNYRENSERFISDESKEMSPTPHSERSLGAAFSSLQKRSEYPYLAETRENCKGIQSPGIHREITADLTRDKQRTPEVSQLNREVGTFANQPRIEDDITISESRLKDAVQNSSSNMLSRAIDVTMPIVTVESHGPSVDSGNPSSVEEYAQLIDETLHCLRKRLLSYAYKDKNTLKELLDNILLFIDDYPETSVLKNKKGIANGCYDDPEIEADWSQIVGLKGPEEDIVNQSNDNIQYTMRVADAIPNEKSIETCLSTSILEKLQPRIHCATHRQVMKLLTF